MKRLHLVLARISTYDTARSLFNYTIKISEQVMIT